MTIVDELNNSKMIEMNRIEFYEALTRSADILSLPPIDYNSEVNKITLR
jgi:hypothetical protein